MKQNWVVFITLFVVLATGCGSSEAGEPSGPNAVGTGTNPDPTTTTPSSAVEPARAPRPEPLVVEFMGRHIDVRAQCSEFDSGLGLPYVVEQRTSSGGDPEIACLYGIGDDRNLPRAHELVFVGSAGSPATIKEIHYTGISVGGEGELATFLSRLAFAMGRDPHKSPEETLPLRRLTHLRSGAGFNENGMRVIALEEDGTVIFVVSPDVAAN